MTRRVQAFALVGVALVLAFAALLFGGGQIPQELGGPREPSWYESVRE